MQNKTYRKCGQFSINSHTYTWREIVILFTACFQKAKSINDDDYNLKFKCRVYNNKIRLYLDKLNEYVHLFPKRMSVIHIGGYNEYFVTYLNCT